MATKCLDVTPENNAECYGNVSWAMYTGINEYPLWYTEYPALSITGNFKDYQSILAENEGMPGNCPRPCDYEIPKCYDVNQSSPGQCHYNLMWAKNTGLAQYPEWYNLFPGLRLNSSVSDFQYVLHTKLGPGNGTGWQCPMPCSSKFFDVATAVTSASVTTTTVLFDIVGMGFDAGSAHDVTGAGFHEGIAPDVLGIQTSTTTTTALESSSSYPWWSFLLLVLLAGFTVAIFSFLEVRFLRKRAPKNKKRTIDMEVHGDQSSSDVESDVEAISAPLQAQPATVYDMPASTAQPFQPARVPVMTRTIPTYPVTAAAKPLDLFDQIDTNRDGVISPEEYARLSLFDQVDTNRDGVISRDEYARLNLFDQLDTNRDGVLTQDELARLA